MEKEFALKVQIEISKLKDYCLNENHTVGKHKAKVFREVLGLSAEHSEWLKDKIVESVSTNKFIPKEPNIYGDRYEMNFNLKTSKGSATVVTGWICLKGADVFRLTTCYIKSR